MTIKGILEKIKEMKMNARIGMDSNFGALDSLIQTQNCGSLKEFSTEVGGKLASGGKEGSTQNEDVTTNEWKYV